MSNQPPIRLEQWVSLILSLSSHRSQNEGHRKFGKRIVSFVYDELPSRYPHDPIARQYFDHVLAEVAWAVRGFSNTRDHFASYVDSASAMSVEQRAMANRRLNLSPLSTGSVAEKFISLIFGLGGSSVIHSSYPQVTTLGLVLIAMALAFIAHTVIEAVAAKNVENAILGLPGKTYQRWSEDAQPRYENIIRVFCSKVMAIEQVYYAGADAVTDQDVEVIIDRAFSFGSKRSGVSTSPRHS